MLEVITPEGVAFKDGVDTAVLPTVEGEIGILPGHLPLLTMLEPGEITFSQNGQHNSITIDQGFAQILSDKISILTEAAIEVSKIDPSKAAEAMAKAENALKGFKDKEVDATEIERLEAIIRFSLAQQMSKNKHR